MSVPQTSVKAYTIISEAADLLRVALSHELNEYDLRQVDCALEYLGKIEPVKCE